MSAPNPSVNDIVAEWLREHGYSGLFSGETACGCPLDDLQICGEMQGDCEAGYKIECEPEHCEECLIREEADCEGVGAIRDGKWRVCRTRDGR